MPTRPCKLGNGSIGFASILKSLINRLKNKNNSVLASDSPKQTRFPAEKGRKLLCLPGTYFPSLSNHRWGLKCSGFSHSAGL